MTYQCTLCDFSTENTLTATLHTAHSDHEVTPELPPYPEEN